MPTDMASYLYLSYGFQTALKVEGVIIYQIFQKRKCFLQSVWKDGISEYFSLQSILKFLKVNRKTFS
jgi:hypothetical protein